MSARRLLLREPPVRGLARLDPAASRHAARVLRLREGDEVVLFDGRGTEWPGTLRRVSSREVEVAVGEARPVAARPGPRRVLATAVPKGRRMTTLVSMATEAGVDRIVPVAFVRSAVRGAGASKAARWRRAAEEAARQSGRADVSGVEEEVPLADLLGRPAGPAEVRLLPTTFGDPPPLARVLASAAASPAVVLLLVGPEGGLTGDEERAAREAGFLPCSLGPTVLRVETAAVAALVIVGESR